MRQLILILFLFISTASWCQSDMPSDISKVLIKMQLEYLQSVQQTPDFLPAGKVKYFACNFGLDLDGSSTLLLVQTRKDNGYYIPQVMISALAATLAINDQDVKIRMVITS